MRIYLLLKRAIQLGSLYLQLLAKVSLEEEEDNLILIYSEKRKMALGILEISGIPNKYINRLLLAACLRYG